jgi:TRAP-type C4-dicarboxylate transport system, periplasmic component
MELLFVVMFLFCFAGTAFAARPLKMYAAYPEDSILTIGYFKAADEIREKTEGRVNIKVFPGAQLGSYEDVIEEIRQGTIEFGATWLTKRYDERLDILNLPGYGALGYARLEKICYSKDSPLPTYVADVLRSMNVVSLGAWPEPYATYAFIKGKRPANLTDFENKKTNIRVPHMPLYRDAAITMGYQTVTIDYSEVFNSMQTGQVDGTTGITLEVLYLVAKDIVKHIDYNRFHGNPCWLLANQEMRESFSEEDRKIVADTFEKWSRDTLAQLDKLDNDYKKKLEEAGIEVYVHSDENYIAQARHMRKEIWPKYYGIFGEQFLKDFDAYVTSMEDDR